MYYAFREITFDLEPKQIKVVDGKLHFQYQNVKNRADIDIDKWPLFPFPKCAVSTVEDKKALLVWRTCQDAIAFMHELLQRVLEGKKVFSAECTSVLTSFVVGVVNNHPTCSPSEEVYVVKDQHKYIVCHFSADSVEETRTEHWVVLVALENEEHYVIDLSGAQYRQYRAVMPHKEYAEKWAMAH